MRFTTVAARITLVIIIAMMIVGCARARRSQAVSGLPAPGGLSYTEAIELNGTKQMIYVRGAKRDNPVILWLDNGFLSNSRRMPGMSEVRLVHKYLEPLHSQFTVVCWDQRGSGGFRNEGLNPADTKVEDYVKDAVSLAELLKRRFKQDKVLLVGRGWGSVIGMMAVDQRPDLFSAIVNINPRVNATETDRHMYDMAHDGALRAGDMVIAKTLQRNGPPPYTAKDIGKYPYLFEQARKAAPRMAEIPEVNPRRLGGPAAMIQGTDDGLNFVYPQLADLDLEKRIPSVDVPVFFVIGKWDMLTPGSIAQRYFKTLKAPKKDLVVFGNSAEYPAFEEPERFVQYITDIVVPQTTAATTAQ